MGGLLQSLPFTLARKSEHSYCLYQSAMRKETILKAPTNARKEVFSVIFDVANPSLFEDITELIVFKKK